MKYVINLKKLSKEQAGLAGGKASALAILTKSGFNVPEGFVILTLAFNNDNLDEKVKKHVKSGLAGMRRKYKDISFAVRSSALSEDSRQASFAGEFETVLDVKTDDEILKAVQSVQKSGHKARVHSYNKAMGLGEHGHDVAVIVQRMIQADFSGVLFTADPVTGDLMRMTGNYATGTGDKLVSGNVNPGTFDFKRPKGEYTGPEELKNIAPVLHETACRIERKLGVKQDIEWAAAENQLYILQSRPITTLRGDNYITGENNDSLTGKFLWSNTNLGEAIPYALTPLSSSSFDSGKDSFFATFAGFPLLGNICGRVYINMSVLISTLAPFFSGNYRMAADILSGAFGKIPNDVEIPLIPISTGIWWTKVLPKFIIMTLLKVLWRKITWFYIKKSPRWCESVQKKINKAKTGSKLLSIMQKRILPFGLLGSNINTANGEKAGKKISMLEEKLRGLVGNEDANILLSNLSGKSSPLESLGPVIGLQKVLSGKMDKETYLKTYGHRCENEGEIAFPRPAEDPEWLDRQLEEFAKSRIDVDSLIEKQHAAYNAAWERFCKKYPEMIKKTEKKLRKASKVAHLRESARSELVRSGIVSRSFALRAGEISGLGDDIYFLTFEEVTAVLKGDDSPRKLIPVRKKTYERYRKLPPYPGLIAGRFDPFKWIEDPNRRSDVFIENRQTNSGTVTGSDFIKGFAGAVGIVEGKARVLDSMNESHLFEKDEILVTRFTNIGWTLLFPRASAIITDIGAPLSHASIVARELGIPAVVGCMNATMRLKTGDIVRVNGGAGTVTILKKAGKNN